MRRLVFAGKNAEAQAYGVEHLTATPTSFRSYEPLGDLWLDFGGAVKHHGLPARTSTSPTDGARQLPQRQRHHHARGIRFRAG